MNTLFLTIFLTFILLLSEIISHRNHILEIGHNETVVSFIQYENEY